MGLTEDVFYTFVLFLGAAYALAGLIGGLFLHQGMSGVWISVRAFGIGGVIAGIFVWLMTLMSLYLGPYAALVSPVIGGFIGGYLLGKGLQKLEADEQTDRS